MKREEMLRRVHERGEKPWDIVVIGGGATGAGVAVDAATRGYDVLLLEREDFGKGRGDGVAAGACSDFS